MDATISSSPSLRCRSLAIVTPVFNDWQSLSALAQKLDELAATLQFPISIIAIDDGSPTPPEVLWKSPPLHLERVELLSLHCNLGHQRAIAVGLSEAVHQKAFSMILVMDCDGEDSPEAITDLLQAADLNQSSIIVASRSKRSEGSIFRAAYYLYKIAFRWLTGRAIDFGNFCLFPADAAQKVAYMPDSWNHLAATIVKSRLSICRVPTARTRRYSGSSSMNLVSLVIHGFSAISVFSEAVLTRLLVVVSLTCLVAIGTGSASVILRIFTTLAIPGWATSAFGFSALLFLQSLTLLVVLLFTSLSSRSVMPFIPGLQGNTFIAGRKILHSRSLHESL